MGLSRQGRSLLAGAGAWAAAGEAVPATRNAQTSVTNVVRPMGDFADRRRAGGTFPAWPVAAALNSDFEG
ncbi:hypothetical protein GCM10027294_51870 [Marinactinospora endophytica]